MYKRVLVFATWICLSSTGAFAVDTSSSHENSRTVTSILLQHLLGSRGNLVELQYEEPTTNGRWLMWYDVLIPRNGGKVSVLGPGLTGDDLPVGSGHRDAAIPLDEYLTPEGHLVEAHYATSENRFLCRIEYNGSIGGDDSLMDMPWDGVHLKVMKAEIAGSIADGVTVTLYDEVHRFCFLWDADTRAWKRIAIPATRPSSPPTTATTRSNPNTLRPDGEMNTVLISRHPVGQRGEFVVLQSEEQTWGNGRKLMYHHLLIPREGGEVDFIKSIEIDGDSKPVGSGPTDSDPLIDSYITPENEVVDVYYDAAGKSYSCHMIQEDKETTSKIEFPPGVLAEKSIHAEVSGSVTNGITLTLSNDQHQYCFLWQQDKNTWKSIPVPTTQKKDENR